jgi:ribosome-associated protein
MDTLSFAKEIGEIILSKRGKDVKILELKNLTTIADYFVICSAESDVQVRAIADEIDRVLSKKGIKCYHKEGEMALNWVLMDYFDVVVHIFREETREYYGLEKFWGDAPVIELNDENER